MSIACFLSHIHESLSVKLRIRKLSAIWVSSVYRYIRVQLKKLIKNCYSGSRFLLYKIVIFFIHILYLQKLIGRQEYYTLLMSFSVEKLGDIEAHLANNPSLTEGGLPGPLDASIYLALGKLPDVNTYPNSHYWYLFLSTFTPITLKSWADRNAPAPAATPAPKKKASDDIDLFSDDDAAPKEEKKPKKEPKKEAPKPAAKAPKAKPIAKSIVVFEVKVYEVMADEELNALAQKVLTLKIDGLVWNLEPKFLDVAYGVRKIQIGCVIEDDKVLTDDIFDQITAWEDIVQSVDMTSMQKL